MKKNVMMRVASVMMVLVLMTSSVISGTFAKYVTEGYSDDNARVAKFGVEVKADFSDMFKPTYATYDTWDGDYPALESVVAYNGTDDLVAPGTEGELAKFDISGLPEVDVSVTYEADLELAGWTNDADTLYCPLVFNVNGTFYSMDDGYADIDAFEAAVEKAIVAEGEKYNANTNLEIAEDDLDVSWKWHFVGKNEGGSGPECQWDAFDTDLGDKAAKNQAATINLTVKCIVTQID